MKFIWHLLYKALFYFGWLGVLASISCQSQSGNIEGNGERSPQNQNAITEGDAEPSQSEKRKRWKKGYVFVTRVIDGDTFWVDNGTEEFKVRFIGVDAPETRNSRWKKKGYYGTEATEYVRLKTERQWVRLESDVQDADRYQRKLAYIYLEDGTFLNADLVEQGYAVVATFPPNVKHVDLFVELQKTAREEKRGLWEKEVEDEDL